jgi:hypothetical protein
MVSYFSNQLKCNKTHDPIFYISGLLNGILLNGKAITEFLLERNLPMKVILAEDATSVVGKRTYVSKWNSVMGFSLPLSGQDFLINIIPLPKMITISSACLESLKGQRLPWLLWYNPFPMEISSEITVFWE